MTLTGPIATPEIVAASNESKVLVIDPDREMQWISAPPFAWWLDPLAAAMAGWRRRTIQAARKDWLDELARTTWGSETTASPVTETFAPDSEALGHAPPEDDLGFCPSPSAGVTPKQPHGPPESRLRFTAPS